MKVFYLFLLAFIYLFKVSAQELRFSELHPTHQPDSLESWLNTHKTPTTERLKNLIRLGRTYTSFNINKLVTHLEEINQLAEKFKSPTGKASYYYLKAFYYNQHQQSYSAFKELQDALTIFQNTKDNAGLLHCYGLLLMMQFSSILGDKAKGEVLKKQYLAYIKQYLGSSPDVHNYLQAQFVMIWYEYGKDKTKDGKKLELLVRNVIEVVNKNKEASYAYFRLNIYLAISYYFQDRFKDSYNLYVSMLRNIQPSQTHELIIVCYNLSNDCLRLNKNDEGISYSQQALAMIEKHEPENYVLKSVIFENLKEFLKNKKRWNEAIASADSMVKYERLASQKSNDIKMLELQGKYEFEQKQQEIIILQKEQRQNTLILIMASLVVATVGFLGYKLYLANQLLSANKTVREQLFGIIAHDLRRPMHAFHQMGELISFHLKRKEYDRIAHFSQALDESGLAIQRMLDNLLNWVISQQYGLSYNPTTIALHEPVNSVVDLYRKVGASKNMIFVVDCSPTLVVYADANALELIIRNLIDNAYKATPVNGKIVIKAEAVSATEVSLSIGDNGNGMPAEMLDKIRKIFLMPERAIVGLDGVGMGLPMVGRFIKRNKGRIGVESSPNSGTTFRVEIPTISPKHS